MTKEAQTGTGAIEEVAIGFTRSPFCRVIHADGAWGGPTPQGKIRMALYSEKLSIPKSVSYEILPGGAARQKEVSPPIQPPEREIEVEVIFDPDVGLALRNWLDDKLASLAAAKQELSKPKSE